MNVSIAAFADAASPLDVLRRVARGDVYTRSVTFREGLTIAEMADVFAGSGLGTADDFVRARSLATDKYRGQLKAQQDIVGKGNPVINEYWVTDSSIQSASPDSATMLLFMQGRRGVAPDERYITATVRVKFVKSGNDWRVDDLTVLTKPKQPGNGK